MYLHSDHSKNFSSGDVQIPIAWKEWVHYYGNVIGGTSDRPISSYQVMLFPDIFLQEVYDPNSTLGYSIERFLNEATYLDNNTPIFGGYEDAFRAGKVVLDIASGEAIAAMQLALKFPQTTIVGVDALYQTKRRVFPLKPGLQLVYADWRYLKSIPTASVDTILSCQGITMWGLPFKGDANSRANEVPQDDGFKIVQALNRVSKPGTVIRFDGNYTATFLRKNLGENWDIDPREDVFAAQRMR